jgi:hypothetical protein
MSLGKPSSSPDVKLNASQFILPALRIIVYIVPSPFAMSNTELVTIAPPSTPAPGSDGHERTSPPPEDVENEPTTSMRTEQELAPVDGGPAAWKLLCAAFVFETLLWGKSLSSVEVDNG